MNYRITFKKGGDTLITKTFDARAKDAAVMALKDAIDLVRRDHPNVTLMSGDVSISIDPDA